MHLQKRKLMDTNPQNVAMEMLVNSFLFIEEEKKIFLEWCFEIKDHSKFLICTSISLIFILVSLRRIYSKLHFTKIAR